MTAVVTRTIKIILLLPLLYLVAGAIGGAVPVNPGWREAERGVMIWVVSNGWHSGLVLPARTRHADWTGLVHASHLGDPARAGRYLWFGWGERDFYLKTPTWAEVSPRTVARAAIGSPDTLMHVDHLEVPPESGRPVRLSPREYRRLVRGVRGSFAPGAPIAGYGPADAFYPARGRYDLVRTCNWWTGRMLAAAGVRVGAWTPFSATVLQWF